MQSIKTRRKEEILPALQEMRERNKWSNEEWKVYYQEMYYINVKKPIKYLKQSERRAISNWEEDCKYRKKTFFQRVKDFISNLF